MLPTQKYFKISLSFYRNPGLGFLLIRFGRVAGHFLKETTKVRMIVEAQLSSNFFDGQFAEDKLVLGFGHQSFVQALPDSASHLLLQNLVESLRRDVQLVGVEGDALLFRIVLFQQMKKVDAPPSKIRLPRSTTRPDET